jgi:hypothetical protein
MVIQSIIKVVIILINANMEMSIVDKILEME